MKVPTPANRSAMRLEPCKLRANLGRERRLAGGGGLQEGAGRHGDHRPAHGDEGRALERHDGAVIGEAREIMAERETHEALRLVAVQRAVSLEIDVEAGISRRHQNVERLAGRGEGSRERARDARAPAQRRGQHGTFVDLDDRVGARLHEAADGGAGGFRARMEGRAAAAFAMGIDKLFNARLKPRLTQGHDKQAFLPLRVRPERQRLHRASAATCEIAAKGRDAVGAWRPDLDEFSARAVDFRDDRLAGQGVGDRRRRPRPRRDAFAARAEPFDPEPCVEMDHSPAGADEEFAIAVAAFDGRSDQADRCASRAIGQGSRFWRRLRRGWRRPARCL